MDSKVKFEALLDVDDMKGLCYNYPQYKELFGGDYVYTIHDDKQDLYIAKGKPDDENTNSINNINNNNNNINNNNNHFSNGILLVRELPTDLISAETFQDYNNNNTTHKLLTIVTSQRRGGVCKLS
ncbi:hypothetical protein LSH36_1g20017 [Paralvinella palmiformis]|uniref:Uncharacterized protein n=1 Tax=Paralvinella palmiformis TaxID=53620 RepID=A0AAD9KG77_9ANNE|nr:hypothetical protein LSH36_1g20017 [Paralvinella palmiformis]